MQIYRLTKTRYQATAFSGLGALRYPGRWHQQGIPVVYASDTPAGALLEILAHTQAQVLLNDPYALFRITLDPRRHLLQLEPSLWPSNWRGLHWPRTTQLLGTRWFEDQDSVILQVPSAIVPHQHNFLINPQHPQFGQLQIDGPEPFQIDPRLANR